jgi:hypothetical protein
MTTPLVHVMGMDAYYMAMHDAQTPCMRPCYEDEHPDKRFHDSIAQVTART